jgi:hypothetical protein
VVVLMSRRSWEAVALAKILWTYWDLGPGAVEVRWTDGPTIAQMCQAARVVPAGPAIGELVHGDLVRYERYLTLMAWAVSLVRHVRGGGQVPQPDDSQIEEAWRERLQAQSFRTCPQCRGAGAGRGAAAARAARLPPCTDRR